MKTTINIFLPYWSLCLLLALPLSAQQPHELRLTLDEYKRFRVEDATIIKRLRVKIKNLEVVVRMRWRLQSH